MLFSICCMTKRAESQFAKGQPKACGGGLWELPNEEVPVEVWEKKKAPKGLQYRGTLKHVFSHFDLHIHLFEDGKENLKNIEGCIYIERDKISTFAFSRAVLRMFELWQNLV